MDQLGVAESNVNVLAIGRRCTTGCKARIYVQQYAISNNSHGKVRNTRNLPAVVGKRGDNGMTRHQEARSILSHCSWRLIDEYQGHQPEGINPYAYAESRSLNEEAKQAMLALVKDSSATDTQIADMEKGTSCARYIETLRKDGMVYRVKVAADNTLESLFA
ncbi:hypothetical protein V1523DRAFT_458276 [Lipomyces doorenjongii]